MPTQPSLDVATESAVAEKRLTPARWTVALLAFVETAFALVTSRAKRANPTAESVLPLFVTTTASATRGKIALAAQAIALALPEVSRASGSAAA